MAGKNPRPVMTTPFVTMIRNILVIYAAFLLCHPVFILYNLNALKGTMDGLFWPMLKGSLLFDTAGIMYISALYIVLLMFPFHLKEKKWFYSFTRILLIVLTSAGIMMNLIDTVYFPYTGCRSTLQVLGEFSHEGGGQIASIILSSLLSNWYLVLLFGVMVWLLCRFIKEPAVLHYRNTYI